MSTSLYLAKPEHEVAYQDMVELVRKHAHKISSMELLAVAANMLGKIVALQDQRSITVAMAMELIAKNIEHGNQQVIERLGKSAGSA